MPASSAYNYFSAFSMSASKSSRSSSPTLILTVVSLTSISRRCSAVNSPKMVEAGCIASDLRSNKLVALRITLSESMKEKAASPHQAARQTGVSTTHRTDCPSVLYS